MRIRRQKKNRGEKRTNAKRECNEEELVSVRYSKDVTLSRKRTGEREKRRRQETNENKREEEKGEPPKRYGSLFPSKFKNDRSQMLSSSFHNHFSYTGAET